MKTMTSMPSRMQGLGFLGWLIVISVVVVFGMFAAKTIPSYLEYQTITGTISSVLDDPKVGLQSETEIRTSIGKRFTINNVNSVDPRDLEIDVSGGTVTIVVDYEVRDNLFYNIDVVLVFFREFSRSYR